MVYPVCASVDAKTGLGQDCTVHVTHNTQMPLCTPESKEGDHCRLAADLCKADPDFAFDLSKKSAVSDVCKRCARDARLTPNHSFPDNGRSVLERAHS